MIEFINDTLANGVGVIRPIGRLNMVSAPHLGANIEALLTGAPSGWWWTSPALTSSILQALALSLPA